MESFMINFKVQQEVPKLLGYLLKPLMVPFYILLGIYLIVFSPHIDRPVEAPTAALLKILPIWYLAFYVYRIHSSSSRKWDLKTGDNNVNLTIFLCGLVMSSIGDICLVYESLFQPGVLAFAVAQFCYLTIFKALSKVSTLAWVSIPIGIFIYVLLFLNMQEISMKVIVFFYNILIHTMMFYAVSSFESRPSASTLSIMLGASIFLISDFTIAVNKWVVTFSLAECIILFTYYIAQLLLTVGVTSLNKVKI